jgi:hypothetical protein
MKICYLKVAESQKEQFNKAFNLLVCITSTKSRNVNINVSFAASCVESGINYGTEEQPFALQTTATVHLHKLAATFSSKNWLLLLPR